MHAPGWQRRGRQQRGLGGCLSPRSVCPLCSQSPGAPAHACAAPSPLLLRSKPGHFRAPNALVPGTAMCMACDGCPTSQCGANGCNSCPNALLNRRVAHPWGLVGMNNAPIMVCRNATGGTTVRTCVRVQVAQGHTWTYPPACVVPPWSLHAASCSSAAFSHSHACLPFCSPAALQVSYRPAD